MIVIMALATTVGTGNVNMHADMGTKMLRLRLHEGQAFEANSSASAWWFKKTQSYSFL